MRLAVLLAAIAMPVVSWMAQGGWFGAGSAAVADRYPTLIVAAGYAFSIWGPIFLLDVVFGVHQLRRSAPDADLDRSRPFVLVGFLATTAWMPVFSQQLFWLALVLIWVAAASLLVAALIHAGAFEATRAARAKRTPLARGWLGLAAWLPLSLHAGWLALAAYLNTAQVVVAERLASITEQLGWSLPLLGAAAALLLAANHAMRGNVAFVAAVAWGLVGVHVAQRAHGLPGSEVTAWVALAIGAILIAQTVWLRVGAEARATAPGPLPPRPRPGSPPRRRPSRTSSHR